MESDLHPHQTLRTRHCRCGETGEQDAPGAHAAPVGAINKFGSQASGASRADGCQRWPDRGGAGITLRVQPREPCFHPPHFGTGLDAVGPAFSGRDRVRDTTTHLMRTRYLRIAAERAHPTFPRGRLSPDLPGIRPPAQVRSARLPVWREVMQRVCGRWQGVGKSHPHIPHATASLRLDRRAHSPPLLGTGCAAPAVPFPLALRQAASRVDPPVKPEGYG